MKQLLLLTVLVLLTTSCDRRAVYGGSSLAGYENGDQRTRTGVITQRDPQKRLLFVIGWTAQGVVGRSSSSEVNFVTSIHGHAVHPDPGKHAVYALQPDYSLRELPLSEGDVRALFAEMEVEGFHTSHSELWHKQIAPKLANVEAGDGR
jgi:hypothetical protein